MNSKTTVIYILLILVIVFQELYREYLSHVFLIGYMPMAIFGTLWNMFNGIKLYNHLQDNSKFRFTKFKTLSLMALTFLLIYTVCWNLFSQRPTPEDPGSGIAYFIFLPLSGFFAIIALYLPYYTINFVSNAILQIDRTESRKWLIVASIVFYPVGLLWIQPKIEKLTAD